MPVCICPNCQARYNIPAAKLGENGRTLKCAKCGNQFFAPPQGSLPSEEIPTPTATSTPAFLQPEPESAPLAPAMPEAAAPDLSTLTTLRHQPRWFRALINSPFMWLGMAALVFTALAFFSVMNMLEAPTSEEPLTAETTPTDAITPPNLVLTDITRDLNQRGDTWILTISGIVSNQGETDMKVPEIRVQLLDPNQIALDFWPAEISAKTLGPGQSSPWQARFLNPPLSRLASFRAYFRDATGEYAAELAKTVAEKAVDHAPKGH